MKRPVPRQSTIPRTRTTKSTVTSRRLPARPRTQLPPRHEEAARQVPRIPARRDVARIIDQDERTLLDVVDNLLNSGVMLNADLMLSLANVDLVYIRLSALLCAADRVLPAPDTE